MMLIEPGGLGHFADNSIRTSDAIIVESGYEITRRGCEHVIDRVPLLTI